MRSFSRRAKRLGIRPSHVEGEEHMLDSLYAALEQQPSSVQIHESLLEVWNELGNEAMASGIAATLTQLDPQNGAAKRYLQSKGARKPETNFSVQELELQHQGRTQEDFSSAEKRLEEGYSSLKLQARLLREEIQVVNALGRLPMDDEVLSNLQAISNGAVSRAVPSEQPLSVRETARAIMETPEICQSIITEDFESLLRWATCQNPPLRPDDVRDRLVRRKTLLEAALPDSMQKFSKAAFAQVEREILQKKYVNSETMLGDPIEEIPKENFFVSEDNYAWDMGELAMAVAASDGVMRNPLSKQMFSEGDIRMILSHPLGQRLKPLQMAQSQLKKGVRQATIDRIEKLSRVMLRDQDVDAASSRLAMDEFLAYMVTIPEPEQNTINKLKIPARDGFSGQPFDYTIGEAVRDAKANATCFHKTGDFLSQATAYLRRQ